MIPLLFFPFFSCAVSSKFSAFTRVQKTVKFLSIVSSASPSKQTLSTTLLHSGSLASIISVQTFKRVHLRVWVWTKMLLLFSSFRPFWNAHCSSLLSFLVIQWLFSFVWWGLHLGSSPLQRMYLLGFCCGPVQRPHCLQQGSPHSLSQVIFPPALVLYKGISPCRMPSFWKILKNFNFYTRTISTYYSKQIFLKDLWKETNSPYFQPSLPP